MASWTPNLRQFSQGLLGNCFVAIWILKMSGV